MTGRELWRRQYELHLSNPAKYAHPNAEPASDNEWRRERQFETLREEHRVCCGGAMDWNGRWVNVINPLPELRGWDEPYDAWLTRKRAAA